MKKLFYFMAMCLVMVSCRVTDEDYQALKSEYAELAEQYDNLLSKRGSLNKSILELNGTISNLQTEIRDLRIEKKIIESGRTPKYIVKFEIKQGTFTLDPWEHVKNSMNAIEVEIPVDREFYNALKIDQDLTDAFKWGSLVMDGDFSNLHMRVKSKRIE